MSLFDYFTSPFKAATLAPPPLPKAPSAPQAVPSYRQTREASSAVLRENDRQPASTDRLVSARNLQRTKQVIRELVHSSPDLSAAVAAALRVGIPERYTVTARDLDGKIDPAGTGLTHELLRRLTFLGNVDGSMGVQQTLQSLSEQLGTELLIEGACMLEVALDKARIPASLNAISVSKLKFYEEDNALRIVQVVGGEEISLDLPTIIYTTLDQDLTQAYPASPLEAAVSPILADLDFNNDTRRALKRAVLPRLTATIDGEKIKRLTPPEILADAEKFNAYKSTIIASVEEVINGLNPEDALVSFDSISYQFIEGGKDPSTIIEKIQGVLNRKLASGAKTLPVVLGQGGSSNSSSTEAVLYLKQANILRVKLNEVYSRALTVALRLMGVDGYVEFRYDPIDLRPERELEAFRSMEQSRVLELLSLGMISDEEACLQLTGNLPPAGYKPLAGTMFRSTAAAPVANPTSNTSAMEQSLTSDAPKAPKTGKTNAEITPDFQASASLLATANAQTARAMDAMDKSVTLMQDMTYAMSQQSQKPVNIKMEAQPVSLSLQVEHEKKPAARKIKVIRDEEGKVSSMEVEETPE